MNNSYCFLSMNLFLIILHEFLLIHVNDKRRNQLRLYKSTKYNIILHFGNFVNLPSKDRNRITGAWSNWLIGAGFMSR